MFVGKLTAEPVARPAGSESGVVVVGQLLPGTSSKRPRPGSGRTRRTCPSLPELRPADRTRWQIRPPGWSGLRQRPRQQQQPPPQAEPGRLRPCQLQRSYCCTAAWAGTADVRRPASGHRRRCTGCSVGTALPGLPAEIAAYFRRPGAACPGRSACPGGR